MQIMAMSTTAWAISIIAILIVLALAIREFGLRR